jgi:restriction system protein
MPILSCLDYYRPILQALHGHADGLSGAQLTERVALATGLTADEREETIGEASPTYILRIRQARYRLKSRDLVEESADDRWTITEGGKQALLGERPLLAYRLPSTKASGSVPLKENASKGYTALPVAPDAPVEAPAGLPAPIFGPGDAVDAPLERVERALREIQEQVEDELLDRLCQVSPKHFERIVLKVLDAMGYGKATHTGGPGDGGIDGILFADRLELERVYVQAKRKKRGTNVVPSDIREFIGALEKHHALKAVLITSGNFTKQAVTAALDAPLAMGLIDGKRLAALMREFGVGVSREHVRVIPELDRTFFEEA